MLDCDTACGQQQQFGLLTTKAQPTWKICSCCCWLRATTSSSAHQPTMRQRPVTQACTCTVMHMYSHAIVNLLCSDLYSDEFVQAYTCKVMHMYSHSVIADLCSMTRVRGKATAGVALRYMSITSFTSTPAHTCPALSPWEPPATPHPCLPLSRCHSSSVSSTCVQFSSGSIWHVKTGQTRL